MKRLNESSNNGTTLTLRETVQPFYSSPNDVLERLRKLKTLGEDAVGRNEPKFAISYYAMALQCYDQHESMLNKLPASFKLDVVLTRHHAAIIANMLTEELSKQDRTLEVLAAADWTSILDPDMILMLASYNRAHSLELLGDEKQVIEKLKYGMNILVKNNQKDKIHAQTVLLRRYEVFNEGNCTNKEHIKSKMANDKTFEQFPIKMVWETKGHYGGRKMVASKDIPKGTVLLRVAPFAATLYDNMVNSHCSTCFQDLQYCKSHTCPQCKLKFCEMCHTDKVIKDEHGDTCKLLSTIPTTTKADPTWTVYTRLVILCLRQAMLSMNGMATKQNTPSTWHKDGLPFIHDTWTDMIKISFRERDIFKVDDEKNWVKTIQDQITRFKGADIIKSLDKAHPGVTLALLRKLAPNVKILKDEILQSQIGVGLFPSAALIKHSCVGNSNSYMDNYGMLVYRSNQDIKAGDEITNSYIDPLLPLVDRRAILIKDYNIYCQCKRCTAMESTEYQCPKCSQPLGKDNLRTWEPNPSIDFDGQVYLLDSSQYHDSVQPTDEQQLVQVSYHVRLQSYGEERVHQGT
ncbi:hypothetical protein SAMD00019534_049260 [Acytostelium subglobosum LB1]|uniref:hypothetical protein n=1 Tax=Acytostelium subglobosum LB1 TaxID=1410327 RepID=UPI0006448BA7|nr:hypothetical protein SAMD00019534_049260 [Acytostelium subglobosum LB1]GAM21751.1 hypothetical protein SAMD00019534_049260 [Acytostelium subglobosum LB1]|eukprot:XP_012754851.1 hypothetical protein SAMD00019534_049260 [Acytostelium subglobosum LB1]